MKITSRRGLVGLAFAALLIVPACGASDSGTGSTTGSAGPAPGSSLADNAKGKETVKFGMVLPYESALATLTEMESKGAELAVKVLNDRGGIGGKYRAELVKKDDKLQDARMATVMRELNDEGVKLTLGFQTTPACKAGSLAAQGNGQIVLGSHCTSPTITNPPFNPTFWRLAAPDPTMTAAMGDVLAAKFPNLKHWDVFGYDYEIGHDLWEGTRKKMATILKKDIPVGQAFWVPIASQDFRKEVQAMAGGLTGDKAERGLFLSTYGDGTTAFFKQAEPVGLLDDYSAMAQNGAYWAVARAMDGRAPNVWNAYEYFWDCQKNPVNDKFVADFKALTGHMPDSSGYQGYVNVMFYAAAIEKAGSTDPQKVAAAFDGLSIDTPTGLKITMNGQTHQATQPVSIANLVGDPGSPDGVKILSCEVKNSTDV